MQSPDNEGVISSTTSTLTTKVVNQKPECTGQPINVDKDNITKPLVDGSEKP